MTGREGAGVQYHTAQQVQNTESRAGGDNQISSMNLVRQLIYLLHAYRCNNRAHAPDDDLGCGFPNCGIWREALSHMKLCNKGQYCSVCLCVSSRRATTHWKQCKGCHDCQPLRCLLQRDPSSTEADDDEGYPESKRYSQHCAIKLPTASMSTKILSTAPMSTETLAKASTSTATLSTPTLSTPTPPPVVEEENPNFSTSDQLEAVFSSMAPFHELDGPEEDVHVCICNSCKAAVVDTRYHCSTCDDFDLCILCYKKENHAHEMTTLGLGLDEIASSTDKEENPQESRRKSIQRCITSLVHACQCKNANCRINSCIKMKRVVSHTMSCRRKTNNGCPICKQLIALCCYHAKHCTEAKCPVSFCPQLKHKLHQAQMLRQRVAIMNGNSSGNATSSNGPSSVPTQDASPQPSTSTPYNSGSVGKAAGGPPRASIIAAQEAQVQAEAQRQGTGVPGIGSIGKPPMQPPARPSPPTIVSSVGKPMNANRPPWPPAFPQTQQVRPPIGANVVRLPGMSSIPQQQQQPQQQAVSTIGPSVGAVAPGPNGAGVSGAIGPAVHNMLQAFKNQNFSQAKWVAVLKKKPQLMAQVLKLKNQKVQQQQQQQQEQQF